MFFMFCTGVTVSGIRNGMDSEFGFESNLLYYLSILLFYHCIGTFTFHLTIICKMQIDCMCIGGVRFSVPRRCTLPPCYRRKDILYHFLVSFPLLRDDVT
ncbi:hypothetical protein BDV06DRAFT_82962 [Aspergillus oleicola]